MKCRDSKRSQVYAAEDLAADHTVLVAQGTRGQLQAVTDRLLDHSWWRQRFSPAPITVKVNRSGERSYYDPERRLVSLSQTALDLNTLCHELAHAAAFGALWSGTTERRGDVSISTEPHHGPLFRGSHVGVRHAVLGRQCGDDLELVYSQFGLSTEKQLGPDCPPAWSAPVLDPANYSGTYRREPGEEPAPPFPNLSRGGPIAL